VCESVSPSIQLSVLEIQINDCPSVSVSHFVSLCQCACVMWMLCLNLLLMNYYYVGNEFSVVNV